LHNIIIIIIKLLSITPYHQLYHSQRQRKLNNKQVPFSILNSQQSKTWCIYMRIN